MMKKNNGDKKKRALSDRRVALEEDVSSSFLHMPSRGIFPQKFRTSSLNDFPFCVGTPVHQFLNGLVFLVLLLIEDCSWLLNSGH